MYVKKFINYLTQRRKGHAALYWFPNGLGGAHAEHALLRCLTTGNVSVSSSFMQCVESASEPQCALLPYEMGS